MENQTSAHKGKIIKSLYFYLVSFVALMMIVFSAADLINTALKTWVFTEADKNFYSIPDMCGSINGMTPLGMRQDSTTNTDTIREDCKKQNEINEKQQETNRIAQRQMNIVRDISLIVVGIPLFLIHWRILRRKDEDL